MNEQKVKIVCKSSIGQSLGTVIEPGDILEPLINDQGVIFPYTPTINVSHLSNYGTHQPTHSNFVYKFFQNHSLQEISCAGDFTAITVAEAKYTVAAMHFFKSCMKIRFGENDPGRGTPPPVLNFSGYGPTFFKNLPVVISGLTYALDPSTDYVFAEVVEQIENRQIEKFNKDIVEETFLPIRMSIVLTLSPCYNTYETRKEFNLDDFIKGNLLNKGYN